MMLVKKNALAVVAAILAIPSWLGFMSMAFMICKGAAQWDDALLRPFEAAVVFGTFVCGSIAAILSAFLLWRERRWFLFIVSFTPLVAVGIVTAYLYWMIHR